jgi:sterol desaturase/sphingolipid hydroxylase (fatty acid hydroxylase superfamily)
MSSNEIEPLRGPVSDVLSARVQAQPSREARGARRRLDWASWVNTALMIALTASGLFCPQGAVLWYQAFAVAFVGLAGSVLGTAALVTFWSERQAERLQGPRRKPALIAREARVTTVAAWVASCLLAWPLARLWSDEPTGLVWDLAQAGGGPLIFSQTFASLFVLDAWLYWKHRLLHTRVMFAFHREHHAFRDPTAFAGFAVGPVESLLTFWPIVLLAIPEAIHYGPLYLSLVIGFVLLNMYLHCGIQLRFIEAVLPPFFFNTSVFHNRHHANADVNFGEAFTIWDRLCRTREQDAGSKAKAARH